MVLKSVAAGVGAGAPKRPVVNAGAGAPNKDVVFIWSTSSERPPLFLLRRLLSSERPPLYV
jgi:hypothetical protein